MFLDKTRLTSDEMCQLCGTVCVLFRASLVFPRKNGLTVYLMFPSPQFVVFVSYISLATNFPCFPISLVAGKRGGETKERGTSEEKRKSFIRKTTERGRESVC